MKSNGLNWNFSISSPPEHYSDDMGVWKDILLVNNQIFITLDNKNIGVFTIKNQYFSNTDNDRDFYKEISPNKIKIHLRLKNDPIKLLPFSSEEIIVILENEEGQKSFERIKI